MKFVARLNFDAGKGLVKKGTPVEYDEQLLLSGLIEKATDVADADSQVSKSGVVHRSSEMISADQVSEAAESEAAPAAPESVPKATTKGKKSKAEKPTAQVN